MLRSLSRIHYVSGPCLSSNPRTMSSITKAIGSFASKQMEASREKQFQKMIDTMMKAESWTFRLWKGILEEQLGSWTMYLPGVSSSKDVQDLKGLKAILDVMTDEELDFPEKVNGKLRERISVASRKPIDQVRSLIFLHKQNSIVQKWIKLKVEKKEPLPGNQLELQRMLEQDARVKHIAKEVFHSGGMKKRGRGRPMGIM